MYRGRINALLRQVNDALDSYSIFGGELVSVDGCSDVEWKENTEKLLEKCDLYFTETSHADKEFARFFLQETENSIERSNQRLLDDEKDDLYGRISPFDGYFDLNEKLITAKICIEWLKKNRYKSINTASDSLDGREGAMFGNYCFVLTPNEKPCAVFYDEMELIITGKRLLFFYLIVNKCYFNRKNDVSFEEIGEAIANRDETQIRKYCHDVNKCLCAKLNKKQNCIVACGTNRPKHFKLTEDF